MICNDPSRLLLTEFLNGSKIAVVGVGGIGSHVALLLSKFDVSIRLIDFDKVVESNLNRQILFSQKDVAKLKVDAAINSLNQLNPKASFEAISEKLGESNSKGLLRDCAVVLDCSDNYSARAAINRHCIEFKIPWVYSAAFASETMLSTFDLRQKSLPCFECFATKPKVDLKCGASTPIMSVSFIASMQVQELLNLAKGKPNFANKLVYCNLEKFDCHVKMLKKKEGCICSN